MDFPVDHALATALAFLFGLLFGSFATMASYRIPRGEELIITPSHCPKCNHRLGFLDLFPVFSWIMSKGRCRHCKTPVHWRYPAIELVMGTLFAVIYWKTGFTLTCLSLLLLSVLLVTMSVIDVEQQKIPNLIHILIILAGLLYKYSLHSDIKGYLAGAIVGLFVAMALKQALFSWRNEDIIRNDDVISITIFGIFTGLNGFVTFLPLSGAFGIIFYILWKMLKKPEKPPFSPVFALSLMACLLFPDFIQNIFYQ